MSPRSPPSTSRRVFLGSCAAAATGLAGCSTLGRECPSPSDAGVATDWAHRAHDPGNSNAAPTGPDALSESWVARVETPIGRPLVADGAVYVPAVPRERPYRGRVLALDAGTGDRRWETSFEDGYRDVVVVAVVDGTAYAVTDALTPDGGSRLYALDAADGTARWRFDAGAIAGVAVAGAVAFVSVLHGSIVALDASDGSVCRHLRPGDGPLARWRSSLTPVQRPAVAAGSVYTPVARFDVDREDDSFDERVVAFDATGGRRWTHAVPNARYVRRVAAVGDAVYVPVIDQGERGHQFGGGRLRSLDAGTGARRWERPVGDEAISTVAAREDVVVVTGTDGTHAFEPATGDRRWLGDAFFGPPVLAGDRVYGRRTAGAFVDTVVAADLATGEPVEAYTFEFQLNRPPVFAGGLAFAHTLEFDDAGEHVEHVADRIHALG